MGMETLTCHLLVLMGTYHNLICSSGLKQMEVTFVGIYLGESNHKPGFLNGGEIPLLVGLLQQL